MTVISLDHWVEADSRSFERKKFDIEGALRGETGIIDGVTEDNKEDIFYMLMFCLCVPQSRAIKAEEAIEVLRSRDFYTNSLPLSDVVAILTGKVRFHPTKAQRLIDARSMFFCSNKRFWEDLKRKYEICSEYTDNAVLALVLARTRKYLIHSVNGMGMKLASHFMRNIGMPGLAILDVHVIDGLKKRGVVDIEKIGSKTSEYLDVERKMKEYAKQVGISLEELDLLLWSQKTGYVFK